MKTSFVDGIYVEIDNGWFHVRASNTEALLRITAEAPTRDAAARLADTLRSEIDAAVRAI
jgi:phosphomannomutase